MPETKHGFTGTVTYRCWGHMIQRCTNPNDQRYSSYGARGITVCDEWIKDFRNFLHDMGPCPEGLQLDRIDNNKGYYKENCRWVTYWQQRKNQRNHNQHTNQINCKNGHEFNGENCYVDSKGKRVCMVCKSAYAKERRDKLNLL